KIGRLQSYIIYVDNLNKTFLDVGQTTHLILPPGNHNLTVKPYLPIEYTDTFVKFLSKINPSYSNKIEINVTQATGKRYLLVSNRNTSYFDTLKNSFLSILNVFLFQKKRSRILLKKVSEENFETCRKRDSTINHLTKKTKRFIYGEVITAFFLAIF